MSWYHGVLISWRPDIVVSWYHGVLLRGVTLLFSQKRYKSFGKRTRPWDKRSRVQQMPWQPPRKPWKPWEERVMQSTKLSSWNWSTTIQPSTRRSWLLWSALRPNWPAAWSTCSLEGLLLHFVWRTTPAIRSLARWVMVDKAMVVYALLSPALRDLGRCAHIKPYHSKECYYN